MIDKRIKPRIGLDVIVNCDKDSKCFIKNISENGMCIRSDRSFNIGAFILVQFALPDEQPIRLVGKVVWSKADEKDYFDNGLEFWYLEGDAKKYIRDFVRQELEVISRVWDVRKRI